MDGVIIDSEPTHQQLEFEMYKELGLNISAEEHLNYVGTSSMDMWGIIRKKHGLKKSPEELLMYGRQKYWDALTAERVPLVEGSATLISQLHEQGFIIQVASSATRPTVDKVLEHFKIDHFFKYRIGGDEVALSKPNPEIFIKAAKQSDSSPEHCLVIEDSANGIKAAKDAGMFCIGYANPGTGNQDLSKADLVIENLNEINLGIIKSF